LRLVAKSQFLGRPRNRLAISHHALDGKLTLNSTVYVSVYSSFQFFQSNVILRHLWKAKFQGKLIIVIFYRPV